MIPPSLLDAALQYAGRGWRVLPLHGIRLDPASFPAPSGLCCTCKLGSACKTPGKHPRIRTGRRYAAATTDPAAIVAWWHRWPDSNVGIATGAPPDSPAGTLGLCVTDIDGARGLATLQEAMHAAGVQSIPRTLQASTGRPGGGIHLYYLSDECPQGSGDGLDCRGTGGLVVAPPSRHVSGATYAWADPLQPIVDMPSWLVTFFGQRAGKTKPERQIPSALPLHLQKRQSAPVAGRIKSASRTPVSDIIAALEAIPNPDLGWDEWNRVGMAAFASDPSLEVLNGFEAWSRKSRKYQEGACAERWNAYAGCPPTDIGFGTLHYLCRETDPTWEPPSHRHRPASAAEVDGSLALPPAVEAPARNDPPKINGHHARLPQELTQTQSNNPLILLNEKYAVIGDVGGKCLVLGWVPSKVDASIRVPSFQSFRAFSERHANQYLIINEEPKQLGLHWLKWTGRRTYEGIDLEPDAPAVLPGPVLNLWSGFATAPRPGNWGAMQDHICHVVAGGDAAQAEYILRYAAWTVQHPGERAEVALVLRGGRGAGKGTFLGALKAIFGHHGLQIFNPKHLTGAFNGHLRNCLLLFVDEAFWAGDKQGESVLKGLLTEPALMIEQKGIDASPWKNRLHVLMAANADWVVPAGQDERRYAMFDVADSRINDRCYFNRINNELAEGGLAAMLHDLLRVPLGDWHPRQILQTAALQAQKARSLDTKADWFESLLQAGELPLVGTPTSEYVCNAGVLLNGLRESGGQAGRYVTANALGRYLNSWGCTRIHRMTGSAWVFPPLQELRKRWEGRYGTWNWDVQNLEKWNERKKEA